MSKTLDKNVSIHLDVTLLGIRLKNKKSSTIFFMWIYLRIEIWNPNWNWWFLNDNFSAESFNKPNDLEKLYPIVNLKLLEILYWEFIPAKGWIIIPKKSSFPAKL